MHFAEEAVELHNQGTKISLVDRRLELDDRQVFIR